MDCLVDGDIVAYRAAAATQKTYYLVCSPSEEGEYLTRYKRGLEEGTYEVHVVAEPVENCLHNIKAMLEGIMEATGGKKPVVYLSDFDTFRYHYAETRPYKEARQDVPKPVHLEAAQDYLRAHWGARSVALLEADDAISIHARAKGGIVCSNDKDLDQIPGPHYDFTTGRKYSVSAEDARRVLWRQTLMGDNTDSIDGLPGVGPKKAEKALEGIISDEDFWKAATAAYVEQFGEEEGRRRLAETYRLVKLLETKEEYKDIRNELGYST